MNALEINEVLFNIDPMNLGSVENNNKEEYMTRAVGIAELIADNHSEIDAIKNEFNYAFWDDCLSEEIIQKIAKEIKS